LYQTRNFVPTVIFTIVAHKAGTDQDFHFIPALIGNPLKTELRQRVGLGFSTKLRKRQAMPVFTPLPIGDNHFLKSKNQKTAQNKCLFRAPFIQYP
jgi:hypothetical protein